MIEATSYQTPDSKKVIRTDHVWVKHTLANGKDDGVEGWLCCLCGAFTKAKEPPDHKTPKDWMPDRYIPLTSELRDQCPRSSQQQSYSSEGKSEDEPGPR